MRPALPVTVTLAEDGGETLQPMTNTGLVQNRVELRLTDWSGWEDGPDIRGNPEDVPGGDGAYDDGPYESARTIVLKGVALAQTPADLLSTEQAFRRLLAGSVRRGTVIVAQSAPGSFEGDALFPGGDTFPGADVYPSSGATEVTESLQSAVRLGGATTFHKTHPHRAEWSFSLYAKDPRRYSSNQHSLVTTRYLPSGGLVFPWAFPLSFGALGTDGRISVTNDGDIPTGVRLQISGGCVNPSVALVETGERLALIDSISSDVIIDTNSTVRSVLRNGAPYEYVMTSDSTFFELPKGTSTLLFLADSGSPVLTATWRDAKP